MIMGHFHVGSNVPGYLPEGDVWCTDSVADAWRSFHDDLTRALDTIDDDGDFLDMDTRRSTITEFDIESNGGTSFDVHDGRPLPVRYWVETAEGPRGECELAGDDHA